MSGINEHISDLTSGGPKGPVEETGEGLFGGEDKLLDGPLQVEESSIPEGMGEEFEHEQKPTGDADEGPSETLESLRTQLETVQNESAGRLNELTGFRARQRETGENMEEMRQMFISLSDEQADRAADDQRRADLEEEAEIYGEEVVNDPTARYIRDQVAANREQAEEYRQQQEHYRQSVNDQRQQFTQSQNYNRQMMDMLKSQEETFSKENPDYGEAYKDLRGKRMSMWSRRGYGPAQAEGMVRAEEEQLMTEQLPRGGNVAKEIYELAKDWGYEKAAPKPTQTAVNANDPSDIERIRAGVGSRGAGQMQSSGTGGGADGQEMTREQFFATVPASKRTELFMNRPDIFEQLGRHGRVIRDW